MMKALTEWRQNQIARNAGTHDRNGTPNKELFLQSVLPHQPPPIDPLMNPEDREVHMVLHSTEEEELTLQIRAVTGGLRQYRNVRVSTTARFCLCLIEIAGTTGVYVAIGYQGIEALFYGAGTALTLLFLTGRITL